MKDTVSKDPLIERIGTHGKFQLRTFLIIQIVGVFTGWQLLVSELSTLKWVKSIEYNLITINFLKAGSFFLPETDYWCSPAGLELARGQRPETNISPRSEENTTDHCLVYDLASSSTNISEISENENTRECTRYLKQQTTDMIVS